MKTIFAAAVIALGVALVGCDRSADSTPEADANLSTVSLKVSGMS